MIPIRDTNPGLHQPVVTLALIAVSVAVFFFVQPPSGTDEDVEFAYRNAAIACELITGDPLTEAEIVADRCVRDDGGVPVFPAKALGLSVIASIFLHGGLLHLAGNMWSLWIFGNNVEDAFGRLGYLLFYVATGIVATAGFVVLNPDSTVPLVGASGAIAGVMGAYLVLYPKAKVVSVFPVLFFVPIAVPSAIFLVLWFAGQFALVGQDSGIAWEAHVAGFLAGVVIAGLGRRALLARVERRRHGVLMRSRG
jgi:membrane associated rhomboid family serine protease